MPRKRKFNSLLDDYTVSETTGNRSSCSETNNHIKYTSAFFEILDVVLAVIKTRFQDNEDFLKRTKSQSAASVLMIQFMSGTMQMVLCGFQQLFSALWVQYHMRRPSQMEGYFIVIWIRCIVGCLIRCQWHWPILRDEQQDVTGAGASQDSTSQELEPSAVPPGHAYVKSTYWESSYSKCTSSGEYSGANKGDWDPGLSATSLCTRAYTALTFGELCLLILNNTLGGGVLCMWVMYVSIFTCGRSIWLSVDWLSSQRRFSLGGVLCLRYFPVECVILTCVLERELNCVLGIFIMSCCL